EAKMGVAPMIGILRVAVPFVSDADAAGKTDAAIDHEQLPVRAIVELVERIPARRVVFFDLDAGLAHGVEKTGVDAVAPYPVDQHVHVNALARFCREGVGESL